MRAVRTKDLHLIRNFRGGNRELTPPEVRAVKPLDAWLPSMFPHSDDPRPEVELYDVQGDPLEHANVADDPAYAEAKGQLLEALDHWMAGTDDPLLRGDIPDRLHPWPEPADKRCI